MKAHSSNFKMVQSVLQKVVKLQSYMGLKSYGYGKIGIFGELLQGSHTTILCGNILQLGLLAHQVLSNSKEVMSKLAELIWNYPYKRQTQPLTGKIQMPSYCCAHCFHLENALTYLLIVEFALLDMTVAFKETARACNSGFSNPSNAFQTPLFSTSVKG